MSALIYYYPVDLTGRHPDNHIHGEKHLLVNHEGLSVRAVAFKHGGYYTQTLKVTDSVGRALIPHRDYVASFTYEDLSVRTGMEVCGVIIFHNPAITGMVYLSAQLVGGDVAHNPTAVEETITYLKANPSAITWAGIVGMPRQYGPGELAAELWEKKSYAGVNRTLEYIVGTIQSGNQQRLQEFRYSAKEQYEQYLSQFGPELTNHTNDTSNPHQVTKAQISLGLVENYPLSTQAQAQEGVHRASYMTPVRTAQAIDTQAVAPLEAHKALRNNPHNVTADQVGVLTIPVVEERLATKLAFNGTAVNATHFSDDRNDGPHWTYSGFFNRARTSIPAMNFTTGTFNPARLGGGAPTANTILRGDGNWTSIQALINAYRTTTGAAVYYAGFLTSDSNALSQIRSTYNSLAHYPVGTIVLYRANDTQYMYGGNDYGQSRTFRSLRGCVRRASGWFNFGGVPSTPPSPYG